MNKLEISRHANTRMSQRGINYEIVDTIFNFGKKKRSGKDFIYYLPSSKAAHLTGKSSALSNNQKRIIDKSKGKSCVVSENGTLITVMHLIKNQRLH